MTDLPELDPPEQPREPAVARQKRRHRRMQQPGSTVAAATGGDQTTAHADAAAADAAATAPAASPDWGLTPIEPEKRGISEKLLAAVLVLAVLGGFGAVVFKNYRYASAHPDAPIADADALDLTTHPFSASGVEKVAAGTAAEPSAELEFAAPTEADFGFGDRPVAETTFAETAPTESSLGFEPTPATASPVAATPAPQPVPAGDTAFAANDFAASEFQAEPAVAGEFATDAFDQSELMETSEELSRGSAFDERAVSGSPFPPSTDVVPTDTVPPAVATTGDFGAIDFPGPGQRDTAVAEQSSEPAADPFAFAEPEAAGETPTELPRVDSFTIPTQSEPAATELAALPNDVAADVPVDDGGDGAFATEATAFDAWTPPEPAADASGDWAAPIEVPPTTVDVSQPPAASNWPDVPEAMPRRFQADVEPGGLAAAPAMEFATPREIDTSPVEPQRDVAAVAASEADWPAAVETTSSPVDLTATRAEPTTARIVGEATRHTLAAGESFWTLSKSHYGTVRYFGALAYHNRIVVPDPNRMRPGTVVELPPTNVLDAILRQYGGTARPAAALAAVDRDRSSASTPTTMGESYVRTVGGEAPTPLSGYFVREDGTPCYRIGPQDTLSGIAQQTLGRASRWRQIAAMNVDQLDDPDHLKPGTVIVLPHDAASVRSAAGLETDAAR